MTSVMRVTLASRHRHTAYTVVFTQQSNAEPSSPSIPDSRARKYRDFFRRLSFFLLVTVTEANERSRRESTLYDGRVGLLSNDRT